MNVVFIVQFVDVDDLVRIFKGTAADQGRRIFRVSAILGHVVIAVVGGNGSHVILIPFVDVAEAYSAFDLSGDAVSVSFRILGGIHEEPFFYRFEITPYFQDFFHEQASSFLDFPGFFTQRPFHFQFHHVHEAVQAYHGLFGGVAGFHVIDVPGHVSTFIRGDGGLDIRPGQFGDQHVQHMGDGGFPGRGIHVFGVHLSPHFVAVTDLPQGNCVGQVHEDRGSRRRCRRYGGQADVFRLDAHLFREEGVDGMLNDQFRHDLPGFSGGGVGVMGSVDLGNVSPGQDALGFTGIHKGPDAVDVPVKHVVLGILMGPVDSFFRKHDGHVGSCHAGNVGMVVDGTTDFFFNQVQGFSLGSDLFSGDGHPADSLGSSFHQAIHVGLAGGTDNHDVVGSMPCSHSHSPDIVFKTAGGDFRSNDRSALGVDEVKIFGGGQGNAVFHGGGAVPILEGAHFQAWYRGTPGPASSFRPVFV